MMNRNKGNLLLKSEKISFAYPRSRRPNTSLIALGGKLLVILLLLPLIYSAFVLGVKHLHTINAAAGVHHPTVLPWIADRASCEGDYQEWRDGGCYDSEHSPEF
jgi:hypothetical protein